VKIVSKFHEKVIAKEKKVRRRGIKVETIK
jgi:hypothetical protein